MQQHTLPADIERTSMSIIRAELAQRGIPVPEDVAPVVWRVIHTTADFDYAENLRFTPGAVARGIGALQNGASIITDTRMAQAGVSTVFLQFDGLEEEINRALRGAALLEEKITAIENCRRAGLPVVLVPTVAPGVNDHALGDILRFALDHAPHVRGVHIQPISYFGRCALEVPEVRLTIPAVLRRIEEQTGGLMQASHFGGGGAESPYCSFHASYLRREDGSLKALPRRRSQCCCVKSSQARDYVSQQWSGKALCTDADPDTSALDAFLQQVVENTFTVSGMVFQDAYNLDLDRLRRCYICEVDSERGMVPFCAYNLTDIHGRGLYRRT